MDASASEKCGRGVRVPRSWWARLAVAITLIGAIGVPVAWASHDFTDVPTEHQFHTQISAIKNAGITSGCGPGIYCPADFVRRDAMAAFLHRGLGRAAWGIGGQNPLDSTYEDVAVTKIRTGGTSGGTGYVIAFGVLTAHASPGALEMPAGLSLKLVQDNGIETFAPVSTNLFPAGPSVHSTATASMAWVFDVDTGVIETFRLKAKATVGAVPGDLSDVDATGQLTLLYVPFYEGVG